MTISEAIKKAIEGGYRDWLAKRYYPSTENPKFVSFQERGSHPRGFEFNFSGYRNDFEFSSEIRTETAGTIILTPSEVVNHPQFWQSLGKAMGWEGQQWEVDRKKFDISVNHTHYEPHEPFWLYQWHKFIDHLAEGKTIEDYFKTL